MKSSKRPRTGPEGGAASGEGNKKGGASSSQTVHYSQEAGSWTEAEASRFFHAYKEHGPNWKQVAKAVGAGKGANSCEALYRKHTSFLSLPTKFQFEVTFLAMMRDQRASDNPSEEGDPASGGLAHVGQDAESSGDEGQDVPVTAVGKSAKNRRTARNGIPKVPKQATPDRARVVVNTSRLPVRSAVSEEPEPPLRSKRKRKSAFANDSDYVMDPIAGSLHGAAYDQDEDADLDMASHAEAGREDLQARGFEADASGADALLALATLAHSEPDKPAGKPKKREREQRGDHDLLAHEDAAGLDEGTDDETQDLHVGELDPGTDEDYVAPQSRRARQRRAKARSASPYEQSSRSPSPRRGTPGKGKTSARKRSLAAQRAARARARNQAAALAHAGHEGSPATGDEDMVELDQGGDLLQGRRAGRALRRDVDMDNGSEEGGMWLRSRENLDSEREGELDLHAREEVDFDASDEEHPGFQPQPRSRRRKALPEKIPPMMSPIKSLFGRRTTAGLMLGIPGHASGSLLSSLLLGAPSALSDAGSKMRPSELRLRRCLHARTRRWCMYEFFCSALDRPWLLACELRDWLAHAGLPSDLRLTRPEWVAVRAALGRPRRLSLAFLHEERAKLEAWREEVRAKYEEVGCGNEVPPDVPRPLQVGQRVTARHPVTRQLHDGDILTTGHSLYRVQFDRPELGVELIKDVDVMPIDPTENLPVSMLAAARTDGLQVNGRHVTLGVPIRRPRPLLPPAPAPPRSPTDRELKDAALAAGEIDRKALIRHVEAALDRKEIVVARLKAMNDVAETGRHVDGTGRLIPAFEREYAQAILDLRDLNSDLERGVVVLEAGTPLVTRVVSSLQRRTNIAAVDHALKPENSSASRMKLAPMAGHVSRLTPEAAWAAAWIEAQDLVKQLQAAIARGDVALRGRANAAAAAAAVVAPPNAAAASSAPAPAAAQSPGPRPIVISNITPAQPHIAVKSPSPGGVSRAPARSPPPSPHPSLSTVPPADASAPADGQPPSAPEEAPAGEAAAGPSQHAAGVQQPAGGAAEGELAMLQAGSMQAAVEAAINGAHPPLPAEDRLALQSTFPGLGLPPNQQPRHALAVPPQQMPQHVQPPVQPPHPAPAPPQPTLSPWVTRAVVACIAMVLTINQSTDFGTPEAVTVSALDRGMSLLQPRAAANQGAFAEVSTLVQALKGQLLGRPMPLPAPPTAQAS